MSKADHMLSILWLLKTRKQMSAKELAEELEIHIRTVYRCIDALCITGVPIIAESGRNGGYRLHHHFQDAPLLFDPDEQKALVQAAVFAHEAGYPHGDALNRAIMKLKRYTNPQQLQAIEKHEGGLEVIHPPLDSALVANLQLLETSIAEGTTIGMKYKSGYEGAVRFRQVDPYGLVHWKSKWYVIGHCHFRQEIRSFRLERILELAETAGTFIRPDNFSARQYLLQHLLPDKERGGEEVDLVLAGNPQAIDDICQHWLMGHALAERTAGEARFKLDELTLYTQVPYYLLSFGGKIRVLEPDGVKQCLSEIAAELLAYYN
ncbi:YafY family transcriptional regulator [Paenibacillus oenotherae]|uniref:YafY family transcriptional regulator n=1 Tax=Paenibacillus oenotherae TaxID=1435645 RepID=A0ABS7DB90_9BACL|nr:YafY family protein [Paenibacillus oenotherae]MBW7477120.1 YafY family transcriptional regulator [Paenibacillus oenotherae]